jgi:G3E family GTPase
MGSEERTFLSARSDMNDFSAMPPRADVYLLTGFLGSGKTTLLRNMLRWEKDLSGTVVLVNEFGQVGIDGAILKRAGSDVVELTSGCVCCTLKGELVQALKNISARLHPRRIIIEATGVAQPESMAAILETPELKARMTLKRLVTVLDVKLWLAREILEDFFWLQLQQARLILLNKIDRVPPESVSAILEELRGQFQGCRVVPTRYCHIDPSVLWNDSGAEQPDEELVQHYRTTDAGDQFPTRETRHSHSILTEPAPLDGSGFVAFHFLEERPLDEARFKSFLKHAHPRLFRVKGPVQFLDRTVLVNFAGGSADYEPWLDEETTRLAFVGWMVEPARILRELEECVSLSV